MDGGDPARAPAAALTGGPRRPREARLAPRRHPAGLRAVEAGVPPSFIKGDPGLPPLRADRRFAEIVDRAERLFHPCLNDPRWADFDLWVGDRDVYAGTQKAGSNRIEKQLGGLPIFEQWSDAAGRADRSMNCLDASSGKWRQAWVDEGGVIVRHEGGLEEGAMRFEREQYRPGAGWRKARVRLDPQRDGSVRHVGEYSPDGGTTWRPRFDLRYVRKPAAPSD